MSLSIQSRTLSEIIDCLCELFENMENYPPHVQTMLSDLRNDLNLLFDEAKQLLEDNGVTVNTESSGDPCQQLKNISKLVNTLLIRRISTAGSEFDTYYNSIISLYNNILADGAIEACQDTGGGGDPGPGGGGTLLSMSLPCVCRIFGLQGKLDGEVGDHVQNVIDKFEELRVEVDNLSPAVLDSPIEPWPEDLCEQLEIVEDLLNILINTDLDLNEVMNLVTEFVDNVEISKNSLAAIGIFPCEMEVDFMRGAEIYLQAAGSDSSDGSSPGVHLRWSFMNKLAEEHLPKGRLAQQSTVYPDYYTNSFHNKDQDYVRLFRIPYLEKQAITIDVNLLDFNDIKIFHLTDEVVWRFTAQSTIEDQEISMRFMNKTAYDAISGSKPGDFINGFTDVIQIKVLNRPMFAGEFFFHNASPETAVKYEAISTIGPSTVESDSMITTRLEDSYSGNNTFSRRIVNELIDYFRLEKSHTDILKIELETYHDFYYANLEEVDFIDDYALSVDDTEVFKRLEDPPRFTIDQQWPAFNDGTKVLANEYRNKWSAAEGIKHGVEKYLEKSTADIYATEEIDSDDPNDDTSLDISYLDLLNVIANDFHIARMLGLGEIDEIPVATNESYIYMIVYCKKDESPAGCTPLLFFSLPTSISDYRQPLQPTAKPIAYGLRSSNINDFIKIGANGYSLYSEERFIRIDRELYDSEEPGEDFFEKPETFDTGITTRPLAFGIEYRADGSSNYVKPEITSGDEPGFDSYDASQSGNRVTETLLAYDSDEGLYLHKETNEGVHHYALYMVNIFSRPSPVSLEISTDYTSFRLTTGLQPPSSPQAALIQSDASTLFFRTDEIAMYQDKVRIKFDWNHIQNGSYQQANKVELFFRENPIMEVSGKIETITKIGSTENLMINTTSFDILSTMPITTISPNISTAEKSKFIGGRLVVEGKSYKIIDITNAGSDPAIHIEPEEIVENTPSQENPGQYDLNKTFIGPKEGARFTAIENVDDEANWTKLSQTINIDHLSSYAEQRTEDDGQITTLTLGGMTGTASIMPNGQVQGSYEISFGAPLPSHSQEASEAVFWEGGIARLVDGSGVKELSVTQIISTNPLSFYAYDAAYASGPLPSSGTINYHPRYVAYIDQENGIFDLSKLLPQGEDEERTTYMAFRAIDDSDTPVAASSMSSIVELETHRVYTTVKPEVPLGPTFATRPDTFGKSTYTFDTKIDTSGGRRPYGMMFLRSNEQMILDALYHPDTVTSIKTDLENLDPNDFHVDRFKGLANVDLETSGSNEGEFKEYDGYRFPEPDHPDNVVGRTYANTNDKILQLIQVVNGAFVPLTKEPVLYKHIKDGTQTEDIEEVTRDEKSKALSLTDPLYHPYPMVRKFQDGSQWKVRFTDYTLDGASLNEYFYIAREIDNQYGYGDRSDVIGPIQLINSMPPKKPEISSVKTVLADSEIAQSSSVEFNMANYEDSENITKVRIYRTTSLAETHSVRLMTLVGDIDTSAPLIDDFSDLSDSPFGETVYYRLVALREVINEQTNLEYIPSDPSDLIDTLLVDNTNPDTPDLEIFYSENTGHSLLDVHFNWEKTTHNGKYYIYFMMAEGTWEKIFEIETNASSLSIPLTATILGTNELPKLDNDGNETFHRFRVDAENSGGLLNLGENIVTV